MKQKPKTTTIKITQTYGSAKWSVVLLNQKSNIMIGDKIGRKKKK